jgi:hypothetical protein
MKIKVITLITVSLLSLVSCDKRKDIISEREELENEAPTLVVRRYQSGKAYEKSFVDTFLVPSTGYKLQYSLTDQNVDISSLNLVAVNSATNVLSITHVKDSLYYLIKLYNNTGIMNFVMSVKDKFGLEASANFKLVSLNQRPSLKIKTITSTSYTTSIKDTLKSLNSTTYNFDYTLLDDNVSNSSIIVIKRTVGDNAIITNNTFTNRISIDLTSSSQPKTVKYDIVVTDPFNLVSDTNKVTIYYYRNLPPKVVTFTSCGYLTGLCQNFNAQTFPADTVGILLAPNGTANFVATNFCKVDLGLANLVDADIFQGGYVTKIKYNVSMKVFNSQTGYVLHKRSFVLNSNFPNGTQTIRLIGPFNQVQTGQWHNQNPFTSQPASFNMNGYLFDNNNDSTFFNINPTF